MPDVLEFVKRVKKAKFSKYLEFHLGKFWIMLDINGLQRKSFGVSFSSGVTHEYLSDDMNVRRVCLYFWKSSYEVSILWNVKVDPVEEFHNQLYNEGAWEQNHQWSQDENNLSEEQCVAPIKVG